MRAPFAHLGRLSVAGVAAVTATVLVAVPLRAAVSDHLAKNHRHTHCWTLRDDDTMTWMSTPPPGFRGSGGNVATTVPYAAFAGHLRHPVSICAGRPFTVTTVLVAATGSRDVDVRMTARGAQQADHRRTSVLPGRPTRISLTLVIPQGAPRVSVNVVASVRLRTPQGTPVVATTAYRLRST